MEVWGGVYARDRGSVSTRKFVVGQAGEQKTAGCKRRIMEEEVWLNVSKNEGLT